MRWPCRTSRPSGNRRNGTRCWPDRVSRPSRRRDGDRRAARGSPVVRATLTRASSSTCWRRDCTCSRPRSPGSTRARRATRLSPCVGKLGHGGRGRFVEELTGMYVGWADGRGCGSAGSGDEGAVVLEVAGLGAYTLLKPESGSCLELPHEDERSFDRSRCSSMSSRRPRRERAQVDRRDRRSWAVRHDPSPLFATPPGCAREGSTASWQATSTCSRTHRRLAHPARKRSRVQQACRVGDVARRRRLHVHVDAEVEVVHRDLRRQRLAHSLESTCPSSAAGEGHRRRRTLERHALRAELAQHPLHALTRPLPLRGRSSSRRARRRGPCGSRVGRRIASSRRRARWHCHSP